MSRRLGFTPLHIQLMLHYATRVCPYSEHDQAHALSPAVRDYTQELVMRGMLEFVNEERIYKTTPKGYAYVQHLEAVMEPIAVWVQEDRS